MLITLNSITYKHFLKIASLSIAMIMLVTNHHFPRVIKRPKFLFLSKK